MDRLEITQYYQQQETIDPLAIPAYAQLALECSRMVWNLRNRQGVTLAVRIMDEPEPYPKARGMFADIDAGNFVVSRANSLHPIWTLDQNVMFRAVHDIYGHYGAKSAFTWQGEIKAYLSQRIHHSNLANLALFTEIIGQTACYSVNRKFPDQKIFIYPSEYQEYIGGI